MNLKNKFLALPMPLKLVVAFVVIVAVAAVLNAVG